MDASMPSLLMRASYADSPNKKMESLEKVKQKFMFFFFNLHSITQIRHTDWTFSETGWQTENMAQAMVCAEEWHPDLLEKPKRHK